jgi:hypothetical protein
VAKLILRGISARSRRRSGNMSEFAACLMVFFLFALFPLINLLMFSVNCGTVFLITRNAAAAAATSSNYGTALTAVQNAVSTGLSSGLGQFSKLSANGGSTSAGWDLYIISTSLSGGANQVYGPDTPLLTAPDPSNFIYEYRVVSNFTVQPFVNMSAVPFIGSVPVVGSAIPFTSCAERAVEDPSGLGVGVVASGGGDTGPAPGGSPAAEMRHGGGPVSSKVMGGPPSGGPTSF